MALHYSAPGHSAAWVLVWLLPSQVALPNRYVYDMCAYQRSANVQC